MTPDFSRIAAAIFKTTLPTVPERPSDWAQSNIFFREARDPIQGRLDLSRSPYLIAPLDAFRIRRNSGRREITFMAPEQMGKTLFWTLGLLWHMVHRPGVSLVYYTSEQKAAQVNELKVEPVLRSVPHFRELLTLPLAKNKQQYRLGENLLYFSGVGSRISSISAALCIADETDDWLDSKTSVGALADLRKRSDAFPESLLVKVCTCKGTREESRIAQEFERSSRGFYFLRCLQCGELTMRSCDIHNLQFEVAEADNGRKIPVPGSLRLVCPKCGREHDEAEKADMIINGDYIHKNPDLIKSAPGFQVGKLASRFASGSWMELATAQLAAGRTGDLKAQIYFDNSVRGLPFVFRKLEEKGAAALRIHQGEPAPGSLLFAFFSADTQDDCWYWVVRGLDAQENSYLLAAGQAFTAEELKAAISGRYAGLKPICAIIDEGGHRQQTVRAVCDSAPGIFCYKGNPRIGTMWKTSDEYPKLILANPHLYHLNLLRKIYARDKTPDHYMYFPDRSEMSPDYIEQITAWRENPAVRDGNKLENYHLPADHPDHYYDAEKMLLVLVDFFKKMVLPILVKNRKKKK